MLVKGMFFDVFRNFWFPLLVEECLNFRVSLLNHGTFSGAISM